MPDLHFDAMLKIVKIDIFGHEENSKILQNYSNMPGDQTYFTVVYYVKRVFKIEYSCSKQL